MIVFIRKDRIENGAMKETWTMHNLDHGTRKFPSRTVVYFDQCLGATRSELWLHTPNSGQIIIYFHVFQMKTYKREKSSYVIGP